MDIKALKKRIETAQKRGDQETDKLLADLTTHGGWEIFKENADRIVMELLQPGGEEQDLQTIGAITLAREFAIQAITTLINNVEATRAAKIDERSQKSE
jgi:hypothetical protein